MEPKPSHASSHYIVQPAQAWPALELGELWSYRNLIYFLAWRDVKLQFKQTVLGAAWAVVQPLALALVFSLIFGVFFQLQVGEVPYLLFFFSGLVPWTLFTSCLNASAQSVVGDSHLIQKVYFPRLVFPIAAILPPLMDFASAFLVLLGMTLVFGFIPGVKILLLPVFLVLAVLTALGFGIWFCAINVRYRDARYLLPLLTTLWLYLSPVFYPVSKVPEALRGVYAFNPMVGVIEGLRWSLFSGQPVSFTVLASSFAAMSLVLISGAFYFRRCEETFADEL